MEKRKETLATQDEMMELTSTLLKVQKLPFSKRVAIRYYLKGMLDNRLISEGVTE